MSANPYKSLRRLRICLSAIFAILLAWSIVDATFVFSRWGQFLLDTQLVPAILASAAGWIVLWVVVTVAFGRVYCSSVCPLGTMQDVAGHMGRRFSHGHFKTYHYSAPVNALRFPIPAIVAACLFTGLTTVVQLTDPCSIYARWINAICRPAAIGFGSVAVAVITFVVIEWIAWRRGRLVCNTVCPIGGLLGLLSRSPIYRVDINTDKCIHCGKCEDVCKSECIDLKDCVVDNSRCVMCFNCTAICPNEAIIVRKGRFPLSTPLMQPTMQCQKPQVKPVAIDTISSHAPSNKSDKSVKQNQP